MRILLILLLALQFSLSNSFGQKYGTAAGLRLGDKRIGLSLRQQLLGKSTAEFIFEVSADEVQAVLLPKYHFSLIGKGLNLYLGAGAHLGNLKDFGTTYGFDAMLGVELKLPALPITVSVDIKPAYHLRHEDWFDLPVAVSVHYVLSKETGEKRRKAREKRKRRKERREKREERKENRQDLWDSIFNKEGQEN